MNDEALSLCWICEQRPAATAAATSEALAFKRVICDQCNHVLTQPYDEAWLALSRYLHTHWREITERGSFDLSKAFAGDAAKQSLMVHLYFVKTMGCKLKEEGVNVDLKSFSSALLRCVPHPDVTLLIADSSVRPGRMLSYQSDVSVLRSGDEVYSALWMHLAHPVGVKICFIKGGAPVLPPKGSPWHPTRQKKIVKISPYKGDTEPEVSRRDLRI